ncbi:MAG: DUF350 domain-containing protein [Acidobacteriota bacterium]
MSLDQSVTGLLYLVSIFAVFGLGKWVYDTLHRSFVLRVELLEKDNLALALAVAGYYFGLTMAVGGILVGPSSGWLDDVIEILLYGAVSILLLNLSIWINDKAILYRFSNRKEIIEDQNVGTGIIVAGNHIAVGLIIAGAVSGEGDLITAAVFWIIGQLILILGGLFYNWITPFDIHQEIERDNAAVGVAFAGVLVALGNVIREAVAGDFISWQENLVELAAFVAFALILLPLIRMATDKLLLPGARLTAELVNQAKPNVGAGVIEAFSYIAASFLVGWVV